MGRNGPEKIQWRLKGALREPPPTPLTQTYPPAQVHTLLFGQYLTQCPETPTLTAPPTPQSHSQHSQHGNPHSTPAALPTRVCTVHKNVRTQHRHTYRSNITHTDTLYTVILAHIPWVSLGQVLGPPKGRRPPSASPTSVGWQHGAASIVAMCQLGKFRAPGLWLRRDQKGEEVAHLAFACTPTKMGHSSSGGTEALQCHLCPRSQALLSEEVAKSRPAEITCGDLLFVP